MRLKTVAAKRLEPLEVDAAYALAFLLVI
jgi:hypothetical protein